MDLVMMRGKDAVCDSLEVAEHFGKRHDKLIFEIERKYTGLIGKGCAQNGGDPFFMKSTYIHEQNGKRYPKYYMNRNGFTLLVMGFTGKEAIAWKMKYIEAFNKMEYLLAQKQTQVYRDTRAYQKTIRKQEMDAVKCLVDYATQQGSGNAVRYYSILSNLADKTVGIADREQATIEQLGTLALAENIIARCISEGIGARMPYKDIYQECRQKLKLFQAALIG